MCQQELVGSAVAFEHRAAYDAGSSACPLTVIRFRPGGTARLATAFRSRRCGGCSIRRLPRAEHDPRVRDSPPTSTACPSPRVSRLDKRPELRHAAPSAVPGDFTDPDGRLAVAAANPVRLQQRFQIDEHGTARGRDHVLPVKVPRAERPRETEQAPAAHRWPAGPGSRPCIRSVRMNSAQP